MTTVMRTTHLLAGVLLLSVLAKTLALSPAQVGTSGSKQQPASTVAGNVEHGRYLAEHVAMCVECHSERDERGNILDSERYMGAPIPIQSGPPWAKDWALSAPPNKGLRGYDDAQAMRLLTEGSIGRNGTQLKLPMPRFRMTREDAADVIAYLRSLQ
jgi:mono/diheme cytochrome c family protein